MIAVPKEKVPLMIRKSDGGFGYGTTDMATLKQRIQVRHQPVQPPAHATCDRMLCWTSLNSCRTCSAAACTVAMYRQACMHTQSLSCFEPAPTEVGLRGHCGDSVA